MSWISNHTDGIFYSSRYFVMNRCSSRILGSHFDQHFLKSCLFIKGTFCFKVYLLRVLVSLMRLPHCICVVGTAANDIPKQSAYVLKQNNILNLRTQNWFSGMIFPFIPSQCCRGFFQSIWFSWVLYLVCSLFVYVWHTDYS